MIGKTVHTFTQEYHRIPKKTPGILKNTQEYPILPKNTLRGSVNIPERPRNR
jgi:hypothetical protein